MELFFWPVVLRVCYRRAEIECQQIFAIIIQYCDFCAKVAKRATNTEFDDKSNLEFDGIVVRPKSHHQPTDRPDPTVVVVRQYIESFQFRVYKISISCDKNVLWPCEFDQNIQIFPINLYVYLNNNRKIVFRFMRS